MQFVPLPAMNPRQPSSRHILASAFGTLILYSVRPALWTWNRIFRRSRGDTTVRDTAPATPPAMNDATTGWPSAFRVRMTRVGVVGEPSAMVAVAVAGDAEADEVDGVGVEGRSECDRGVEGEEETDCQDQSGVSEQVGWSTPGVEQQSSV
jgi:hypothetical protein